MSVPKPPKLPPPQKPRRLFQLDNGNPMYFFIHPGQTKLEVAPLILKNGGKLCPKIQPCSILLAREGEIPPGDTRVYISTSYITHSIARKRRLAMEKYILNPQPRKMKKGQVPFTKEEDWAIMSYVQKRKQRGLGDNLMGTTFWMDMAEAQVTPYPWQAMRTRYLRHLQNLERMYRQSRKLKGIIPKPRPYDRGARKKQVLRTPNAGEDWRSIQKDFFMYKKLMDASQTQDPEPTTSTSEPPSIFQMANEEFEHSKEGSRKRIPRKAIIPENTKPKTVAEDKMPPDPKKQAVESTNSEDLTMSESLLSAEKPPSGPSAEKPPSGPSAEKPPSGPSAEKPPSGPSAEKPPSGPSAEKPPSGPSAEKPPSGPSAEKPPSGPSAEDVALAVEDMKRLMEEFGVDLDTVTQALLKTSGEVAAAACCLKTGHRSDGCPLWTRQDDLDLLSGADDLRSKLLSKYGAENVNAREAFRKN